MAFIENTIGNTNSGGSIDQDNIDIFRYYSLGGRLSGDIVSVINNGQPFVVNEKQSLWIETISYVPNPNDSFSNIYATSIYKLIDLGKGTYGLGGDRVVDYNNLKLITETQSTSEDIENLESTQIIDLGWNITGTNISDYVNDLATPITFQAQEDGYVLIKAINNSIEESYLFLGVGGTYGQDQLQTAIEDYQLIPGQASAGLQIGDNISLLNNDVGYITNQPVSATESGIVNNVSLQELGGVDKLINGVRIGKGNATRNSNIVFGGAGALGVNTTGLNNTAIGAGTLASNTTGGSNTAIGGYALYANTTGLNNLAIGTGALQVGTNPRRSTAIGNGALYYSNATSNTAIGLASMQNNTTGNLNVAVGYQSGGNITTGIGNSVFGSQPGVDVGITTGSYNAIFAPNNGLVTGIATGSGNAIFGKVTGLPSNLENNVIISNGVGNIALRKLADGTTTVPSQTNTLITEDVTGKAVITKEYFDDNVPTTSGFIPITGTEENNPVTGNIIGSEVFDKQGNKNAFVQLGDIAFEKKVSRGLVSGDSTIASYLGQTAVSNLMLKPIDIVDGATINSIAVPGDTIDNQKARWTTDVADKLSYDYIIVQIGLNDVVADEPEEIIQRYQDYIDVLNATKRSDAIIIAGAMNPARARLEEFPSGYSNFLALNEAIMGGGSTPITGVDYRIDTHFVALKDSEGNLAQFFDMGDFIHENNAGRALIAEGYRAFLKELGYFPSSSVNTILGGVLHTSGNEDVRGEKTFLNRTVVQGSAEILQILGTPTSVYAGLAISGDDADTTGNKVVFFQRADREAVIYNYAVGKLRFGTNDRYAFDINLDGTTQSLFNHIVPNATASNHALAYGQLGTGWASYADTRYTSADPFIVNSGVTSTLLNNSGTVINNQLPIGVTSFYDSTTSKITPQNDGDYYVVTVRFKAQTTAPTAGYFDFGIDIGGAMGVQFKETKIFAKGAGIEHNFSITVPLYSASTFIANGGLVKITSGNGDMTIYDVAYHIDRTHKYK